jgi:hypothetical protein
MFRAKVIWSPIEVEYLKKNKTAPINQLCIALAKSVSAVKKKLSELKSSKKLPFTGPVKNKISRIGRRKDCDNQFFRSGWEADVYRWLKQINTEKIEYEPKTFSFAPFGILKGTVSYTPDFYVTGLHPHPIGWMLPIGDYYIEVKGYLKSQDMVRLNRFKKYYPIEFARLLAVAGSTSNKTAQYFQKIGVPVISFKDLKKQYASVISHWESK